MASIKAELNISGIQELQELLKEQESLLYQLESNTRKIAMLQMSINLKMSETEQGIGLTHFPNQLC